jgi:hypothetical protein
MPKHENELFDYELIEFQNKMLNPEFSICFQEIICKGFLENKRIFKKEEYDRSLFHLYFSNLSFNKLFNDNENAHEYFRPFQSHMKIPKEFQISNTTKLEIKDILLELNEHFEFYSDINLILEGIYNIFEMNYRKSYFFTNNLTEAESVSVRDKTNKYKSKRRSVIVTLDKRIVNQFRESKRKGNVYSRENKHYYINLIMDKSPFEEVLKKINNPYTVLDGLMYAKKRPKSKMVAKNLYDLITIIDPKFSFLSPEEIKKNQAKNHIDEIHVFDANESHNYSQVIMPKAKRLLKIKYGIPIIL